MSVDLALFVVAAGAAPVLETVSLWLAGAALGVGFTVGLTGVGAGSLMTPVLIFFFGIPAQVAIGTDLLFAAFTRLGGTVSLRRTRQVDWPVVGHLALGSMPAALAVLVWLWSSGPGGQAPAQALMTTTLGGALLLTAAAMLVMVLRPGRVFDAPPFAPLTALNPAPSAAQPRHWLLSVLLGAGIGALVALSSVGAGVIGVAVLLLLYPGLSMGRISSADIAHAVPLTLVAGLGHAAIGSVDWLLLGTLLAGSLPGIWLGLRLAGMAPHWLQRLLPTFRMGLALVLASAGGAMLLA